MTQRRHESNRDLTKAAVGSIVWAFRRFKKPRSREMSARGYALHSVRPKLFFSTVLSLDERETDVAPPTSGWFPVDGRKSMKFQRSVTG